MATITNNTASFKDKDEVLQALAAGSITVETASRWVDDHAPKSKGNLYCKVSAKGALSVYGLQRMPVTLYLGQWERLIEFIGATDGVAEFIAEHRSEFATKPPKE